MLSLSLAGCGRQGNEKEGKEVKSNGEVVVTMAPTQLAQTIELKEVTKVNRDFAEKMNDFAYRLLERLEDSENIFFSPYSISCAISMLDNCASGDTKKEIEKMLGVKDLEDWNANLKYFQNSFNDNKAVLNTANGMWLQENIEWKDTAQEQVLKPLAFYYDTELKKVDFAKAETKEEINQWIADKTDNMIKNMIAEMPSDVVMCLANAVYFNGEWQCKFTKEETSQQKFYGSKKTSTIDMMSKNNVYFRYTEQGGIKAVELPYGEGSIAMDLLLPMEKNGKNIQELFAKLTPEEKNGLFAELSEAEDTALSKLALPKFQMEYEERNLEEVLRDLGMVKSFTKEADFSLLGDGLYADKVMHKAKIEVDEEGSKAAAATVILMRETCMLPPEDSKEFVADQPFLFIIRDTTTGTILFMGSVQDL